MVNGLEISGYDLVSSKSVSGTVGQVQISKDNPNPITINFIIKGMDSLKLLNHRIMITGKSLVQSGPQFQDISLSVVFMD